MTTKIVDGKRIELNRHSINDDDMYLYDKNDDCVLGCYPRLRYEPAPHLPEHIVYTTGLTLKLRYLP